MPPHTTTNKGLQEFVGNRVLVKYARSGVLAADLRSVPGAMAARLRAAGCDVVAVNRDEHRLFPPIGRQLTRRSLAWIFGVAVHAFCGESLIGDNHVFVIQVDSRNLRIVRWAAGAISPEMSTIVAMVASVFMRSSLFDDSGPYLVLIMSRYDFGLVLVANSERGITGEMVDPNAERASVAIKKQMREKYDAVGLGILSNYKNRSSRAAESIILAYRQPGQYWMEHKIATAFALGRFSRTDRLLEVGCTAGDYTLKLARDGYQVVGLDISPESIKAAQVLAQDLGLSNAEFIASDAEDMRGIPDNSFEGVFSFSTLRYAPDPVRSLREIRRVLRPGGRAVVDFPNKYCPWFEFLKFLVGAERHIHDHTYSTGQVKRMMEQAGFVDIQAKRIIFFWKGMPGSLTPLYKVTDFVFERAPVLNYFAGIIMCKGEKTTA